jgi:hypothetical protein
MVKRVVLLVAVAATAFPMSAAAMPAGSGRLLGQLWKEILERPAAVNPLLPQSLCLRVDRSRVVVPLPLGSAPLTCTIEQGTPILASAYSTECSDVEAPPFFGSNYAEQVACARAADTRFKDTRFTLDGRPIDFFEVITPPEEIRLPPDNILGVPAGTVAHFAGHGWNVIVRSLPVGLHTLRIHQRNPPPGFPDELTSIVNVVPRG